MQSALSQLNSHAMDLKEDAHVGVSGLTGTRCIFSIRFLSATHEFLNPSLWWFGDRSFLEG